MSDWQPAEKVQKNAAGEYRAMINGQWTPVEKAQKNASGAYRVILKATEPALAAPPAPAVADEVPAERGIMDTVMDLGKRYMGAQRDLAGGLVRGAGSIGATLLTPGDLIAGNTQSIGNPERRQAITEGLREMGVDPESTMFGVGKLGGEVAGTAGVGGIIAKPVAALATRLPALQPVANALVSGGMSTGATPANLLARTGDLATRVGAGAVTGAVQGGMVNPEEADTGAAVGGVLAGALPPVAKVLSKAAGFITDLVSGNLSKVTAGNIARDTAGDQIGAIKAALSAAPADVTAAQATAGVPKGTWQALGRLAEKDDQTAMLLKRQVQDRLDELHRIAQGSNATEAKAAVEESKQLLNAITGGMREGALSAANVSQQLDAQPIVDHLHKVVSSPGMRANPVLVNVVKGIQADIDQLMKANGGVLDANDLYMLRKDAIADKVAKELGATDPTVAKKLTVKVLNEVRPMIDEAIEAAGGKDWSNYLRTYSEGMRSLEQRNMAAQAARLFENAPKAYLKLVRGNNPDAVEAIFGPGSYDVFTEMAQHMPTLEKAAAHIERGLASKEAAQRGAEGLRQILMQDKVGLRLPNMMTRVVTSFNKAADMLENHVSAESLRILKEGMRNGQSALDLLNMLPASDRVKALSVLTDPKTWGTVGKVGQAAAVQSSVQENAMAPPSQNKLRRSE